MNYRLWLNEKLRGFRAWIEARDSRRFTLVVFGVMMAGILAVILSTESEPGLSLARRAVGTSLIIALELLFLYSFLKLLSPEAIEDNNLQLVVASLFLSFAVVARLLLLPAFSPYLIPMAALGMLTAVILNVRAGLLLVLLASLNVGLMTHFDLRYTVVTLFMGLFSLQPMLRLDQRTKFLTATGHVILAGATAILGAELLHDTSLLGALRESLWALANGPLSLVLAVSLLIVFEAAFNLTTPIRLLELANPAHPLLRRLMQVAPGTYNHSILMGNLAEAAAEAIGANGLLARVGAYYHDIGKVARPEYFIENQLHIKNPHDKLNPNLSRLAITAHVKDGAELAQEYGLPKPITDIIRQHHGTSVLSYFYQKAKESSADAVTEESYRYEAEKPHSREAAIIMLADSVEAAVKAMKNPTPKKLQGLISEIIKQKVDDGQLDHSGLTLGDLHNIREVFEQSLWGTLGGRIAYPGNGRRQEKRVAGAAARGAAAGGGGPVQSGGGAGSGRGAATHLRAVPSSSRYDSEAPTDVIRLAPRRDSAAGQAPGADGAAGDAAGGDRAAAPAGVGNGAGEDGGAPLGDGGPGRDPGEDQAPSALRHSRIDVSNETPVKIKDKAVRTLVRALLEAEKVEGEVAIGFIDKNEMSALNRRYRNLAEPTDVLAFPEVAAEAEANWPVVDDEADGPRLGDVVICPAVAAMYAAEEGTTLGEELRRLVVHGVLHLLGYDHEVDRGEMREREVELLASLPPTTLVGTTV